MGSHFPEANQPLPRYSPTAVTIIGKLTSPSCAGHTPILTAQIAKGSAGMINGC